MKSNSKRRHHILPRLYLKGFTEQHGDKYLWVYERGKEYNPASGKHPGSGKGKFNPYKDSIKSAGAERGAYYSSTNAEGITDTDKYENMLEKIEKPANPVLAKIRAHHSITDEEKWVLAKYVLMMHKRGPRRNEKFVQALWPDILANNLSAEFNDLCKSEAAAKAASLGQDVAGALADYQVRIPDDVRLQSMVGELGYVSEVIAKMSWNFLVAPSGCHYLAGDNPVFMSTGLSYSNSELLFPISSDVALKASHGGSAGDYIIAAPAAVTEINRRIAGQVTSHAYYQANSSIVTVLLNRPNA